MVTLFPPSHKVLTIIVMRNSEFRKLYDITMRYMLFYNPFAFIEIADDRKLSITTTNPPLQAMENWKLNLGPWAGGGGRGSTISKQFKTSLLISLDK